MARTPSVADNSSKCSASVSRMCEVSELPASGRLIVTRATPSSMAHWIWSSMGVSSATAATVAT
jgi:hypothetical protein